MLHPSHLKRIDDEIKLAAREGRSPDPGALNPEWRPPHATGARRRNSPREWKQSPFILPTHLLDRTQPADLGYTGIEGAWKRWHADHPGAPRDTWPRQLWKPPQPDCPVSSAKNLEFYVLGHRVLADQIGGESRRDATLVAEIGYFGHWRCRHVYEDGLRCLRYAESGILCKHHRKFWKDRAVTKSTGYAIRDVTFRDLVEKHQNDPGIRSIAGEVAVMRSILDMLLSQVKLGAELNDLDPGTMNAMLQTSKMITEAAEKMVSIEGKLTAKLSIEQLSTIATTMINAVIEICQPTPDQAHRLAIAFAKATNPKTSVMVDAETGELVTKERVMEDVLAHPVQERITMTGGQAAFTEQGRVADNPNRPAAPEPMPRSVRERLTDMARHGRTWEQQP